MKKGKLIIIVAPSGTGKTTLVKRLRAEFPMLKESVSYTTRPMRKGEVDGSSYHFVEIETFLKMKNAGEFIEWAQVHENFYGTSKKFVEEELRKGENILFDLDVQGTDNMKAYFNEQAHAIFIAPPSVEILESRLRARGTETTGVINVRIMNSKREILRRDDYDYCIVNDELERAYKELKDTVINILEK